MHFSACPPPLEAAGDTYRKRYMSPSPAAVPALMPWRSIARSVTPPAPSILSLLGEGDPAEQGGEGCAGDRRSAAAFGLHPCPRKEFTHKRFPLHHPPGGPPLPRGRGRNGGITQFYPPPRKPAYPSKVPVAGEGVRIQPDAAAGSGRAGPGGGDVSLRSRRALVCRPARSWAAIRADRRGRAGRVRDKRVNSPARPGPAGERPRGASVFVETAHDYPYAGRRPGAPPPPHPLPAKRPRSRVRHKAATPGQRPDPRLHERSRPVADLPPVSRAP